MAHKKSVVITGVSTGIGWGAVKVLTAKGFHVFGSVRKQADADRLQAEFGDAFTPLIFDVTDGPGVRAGARLVEKAWPARPWLAWSTTPASRWPGRCSTCPSTNGASSWRSISPVS
jgi:NAD(P)-dependent dehydrogenase (short-subunit alcohol dehydrogenase family)